MHVQIRGRVTCEEALDERFEVGAVGEVGIDHHIGRVECADGELSRTERGGNFIDERRRS
jgi:hypothetical protein